MRTGQLGYGQDHRPLGTGDLNANRLMNNLQKRGFNGPVIFELNLDEALKSLSYLKKIGALL